MMRIIFLIIMNHHSANFVILKNGLNDVKASCQKIELNFKKKNSKTKQ